MKKHVLAASLLMSAMTTFGAGYQINLQGLRQLAMGGTGTAWPWDAATIFYNPGGLARLKGIQAYVSVANIMPSTAFGNQANSGNVGTSVSSKERTFTPFNLYVGGPIQEDSRFAIGLGVYSVAGMGLSWDDNWLGKYLVESIDLQTLSFQPTISFRASDFISVGAGFVHTIGTFDFRQALPVHGSQDPFQGSTYDEGNAHLHSNAAGEGFNLGVQLRFNERLQMGLTYRSQINMDISGGTAIFNVPQSLRTQFPNTHFDSQLPLPQVASIGIGYRPAENLTLQLDLNYTGWNSFDSLRLNFSDNTASLHNMHAPRHYRNTLTPRIGANYRISKIVSVMLGGAFDPSPVVNGFVSPDLPDADRAVVTGGVAVKPIRRFTILAAFEAMGSVKRAATYDAGNFNGTYKTAAFTPGIAVYYNF
jgi:long-chain fatty acid transport protein